MLTKADWTIEILKSLKNLPFVSDLEIIKPPDDVEADLGILIKVRNKISSDGLTVSGIISDFQWKVFDETGDLPGIYWDWLTV
ncbi:MAG: hypothetical protein BWK80_59330 [Desulfobacteraceae bacterium IS3]|nr:MAG: hypothetical protein BWK80_59330 [Desulfobacteraceae bacterium IS3]